MQVKTVCSAMALWAVLHSVAHGEEVSNPWLQRLQAAQSTQSYQGAFVYERKSVFSTHQVWRQVQAGGDVQERYLQLNGPAHELVRMGGRTTCSSAANDDDFVVADTWPVQALNVAEIERWYEVRDIGRSRVAGRDTVVLLFAPRDQHRYPIELHLDAESAIPLKSLLLNEHGQLLERFQFVQFQAVKSDQYLAVEAGAGCHAVANTASALELELDVDWSVSWVPPGFTLLNSHYRMAADGVAKVLRQAYSDGVAHFTVFFEQVDYPGLEGGRRQFGPTSVASRKFRSDQLEVMVTVVGEIPLGAAERIALSMQDQSGIAHD